MRYSYRVQTAAQGWYKLRKILFLSVISVCAVGCAVKTKDEVMLQGQPPAYGDGFRPGCSSGYVAAGHPHYKFQKDVQRMTDDELYAMGWNDGFAKCKGEYESFQRR